VVSYTPFGSAESAKLTPVALVVRGSYGEPAGAVSPVAAENGCPADAQAVDLTLLRETSTSPNAFTLSSKNGLEVMFATNASFSCCCSSMA